ncbi:RNA polymerase sigma factor [Paracoccus sp. Z330]|uniref:RNA polymerase sigma factor n=1 Tax=Paracoccus onchidii TaxID=3017813 RepID=A0ABT4ZG09_9RHOB|nr:RNA polymerase sigma factor [Paracoccus onchidii]MDB6178251.1 RNA polymerase sigma factor [Paracoccus onchidii]
MKRAQIETLMPEMRAYARSVSGHVQDAEDLVQDAIERALSAPSRPDMLDELRPWIFRVIRNLHYDELRRRRVRREYSAAQIRYSDEATTGTDTERDTLIRLAFEKLPPEPREILFLVDVMGFKYSEAAQVLNLPAGTVMSRVSRARKALRDLIAANGTNTI